jgi:hypothetical protein
MYISNSVVEVGGINTYSTSHIQGGERIFGICYYFSSTQPTKPDGRWNSRI